MIVFIFVLLGACNEHVPSKKSMNSPEKSKEMDKSVKTGKKAMSDIQKKRAAMVGQTIEEVLTNFSVLESELEFVDEPPAKLRALKIDANKNRGVSVDIWLVYEGGVLFSERMEWPLDKIKNAKVRGIKFTNGKSVERYGKVGLGHWPESR